MEVFHCGGTTDVEATLLGTVSLRDGETQFSRSRFVGAISKPNTVVGLDEINRSGNPKAQALLLSCMDFQSRLVIDQEDDPERRVVDVAEGVTFVATANIGADYVGTEPLDPALLDRMIKLRLSYSEREPDLLVKAGLAPRNVNRVMKIARAIRNSHGSGALTDTISTRGILFVAELLEEGFLLEDAFEAVVGVYDDDSRAALRAILKVAP